MNPVGAVRDSGWYEVLEALKSNPEACTNLMKAWYPKESGLLELVERIHEAHPDGFELSFTGNRASRKSFAGDLSGMEKVDLALETVRKAAVATKVRNAAKALSCLGMARRISRMIGGGDPSPRPSMVGLPAL